MTKWLKRLTPIFIACVIALCAFTGQAHAALVFHCGWETGSVSAEWSSMTNSPTVAQYCDWVTPTGNSDPQSGWTDETNAYNGNTGNYAESSSLSNGSWSEYLYLTISSFQASGLRYYVTFSAGIESQWNFEVDIERDSGWVSVESGTLTGEGYYISKSYTQGAVTQVRLRAQNNTGGNANFRINDFDFADAVKTGSYCMRCNTSTSTAYVSYQPSTNIYQFTFYLYIVDLPDTDCILFGDSSAFDYIKLTTAGEIDIYDQTSGKVADGSTQLGTGQWYRISGGINWSTDKCSVWIDGTIEHNNVSVTEIRWGSNIDPIEFGVATSCTADLYFDDIILGTTPSSATDLGDIRVDIGVPIAESATHDDWKDTADGAQTYDDVDEVTASTSDWAWFESNGSLNQQTWTTDAVANLIGSIDSVQAISSWFYYTTGGGGANQYYTYMRDNGTDYSTGIDDPKVATWVNRYDAVMPNGGGAWTEARADAYEIGMATDDANKDIWCYAAYKMIAYIPPAGACSENITNTPSTWSVNSGTPVSVNTTYWSKGSAPTFPLDDSECQFTVTNSSGGAVDITIVAGNFTGGNGWALGASNGSDIVVLKAGKSGDANEGAMVTLTTSAQAFISALADSGTKKWELMILTPTVHSDAVNKETTVTISATCS